MIFFEEPTESEKFKEQLKKDLFKYLKHKKMEESHVEPQVQDAKTIEKETEKEDEEFYDLSLKYNEINDAATEQQKKNNKITSSIYLMMY